MSDTFDILPAVAYKFECPICEEVIVTTGELSGDCINCHREFDQEETVQKLVSLDSVRELVKDKMDAAVDNHEIDRVIGIYRNLLHNLGSTHHGGEQ